MKQKTLATLSYSILLTQLQKQIKALQAVFETQLVAGYWHIGRIIDAYLRENPQAYLSALTRKLSVDLDIHERTLQQCHQFFHVFPKIDLTLPIRWSHYRALLSLGSDQKRIYWQKRIIKDNISFKELLVLLKKETVDKTTTSEELPEPIRGALYHYRLLKVSYVDHEKSRIMIDCGFDNCVLPPKHDAHLENKRIVSCLKENNQYVIKMVRGILKEHLYTFKAHVQRVIDGDTLLCNVDCGFGIWSRQRLRLKGIDAPEINTVSGLKAKRFVEQAFSSCAFIIVKTFRADKYGRYLADIFFDGREKNPNNVAHQGQYLNQVLINKGLAKIYA